MNIYQRINEVRKAVAYIQKTKEVKVGGSYMVVTHDEVTAALRDHLIAQGIIICPMLITSAVVPTGTTTASGVPIIRYEAHYNVAFVNIDAPDDRLVLPLDAHALDQGDKAPGKALSYATKYALLKVFSIETGEAEEERIPAKSPDKPLTKTITPTEGAWDDVPKERHELLNRIGSGVIDYFSAGESQAAYRYLSEQTLSNEDKVAIWTLLDSKQRRALKLMAEDAKRDERITKLEKV